MVGGGGRQEGGEEAEEEGWGFQSDVLTAIWGSRLPDKCEIWARQVEWNGIDRQLEAGDSHGSGGEVCECVCVGVGVGSGESGAEGQMKRWHSKDLWTWDIKQTVAETRALSGKISPTPMSYKTWSRARKLQSRQSLISQVRFSIAFQKKQKNNGSRRGAVGIHLREKQTDKRMCVKGGCVPLSSLTVERLVLFARKRDEKGEFKRPSSPLQVNQHITTRIIQMFDYGT